MKSYYKLKMIIALVMLNNCTISNAGPLNDEISNFAERCGADFIVFLSECTTDKPSKSNVACLAILNDYSKNCL